MSNRVSPATYLVWILRAVLGGLFVFAGAAKLRDPVAFAIEIGNYRLWPELAPYLAATLPAVEIACGLGLLLLPLKWRRSAALAVCGVMVAFTAAVASTLVRGINIDCGCFGGDSTPVTGLTVARDLALIAMAGGLLLLDRPGRPERPERSGRGA